MIVVNNEQLALWSYACACQVFAFVVGLSWVSISVVGEQAMKVMKGMKTKKGAAPAPAMQAMKVFFCFARDPIRQTK